MTWREAFLLQARSDHAVFDRLGALRVEVEPCHRLHYFQMATEKLAKAFLTAPAAVEAPATVHTAFVRMLQVIKGRPDIRRQLGYANARAFASFINSLLGLANRVQGLAPAVAGLTQPNPEYPWRNLGTGEIQAPAEFEFPDFDRATKPQMAKLDKLVRALLRLAS